MPVTCGRAGAGARNATPDHAIQTPASLVPWTPPPVTRIPTKFTLQPDFLPIAPTAERVQRIASPGIVAYRVHHDVVEVDHGDAIAYGEDRGGAAAAEAGREGGVGGGLLEGRLVVFYGVFSDVYAAYYL